MAKSSTTANYFHSAYATSNAAQSGTASKTTPNATYRGRPEIRTESRTPALIDSPIRFNFMMKGEVEATTLKELYVTLTEKKGWRTICSAFYHGTAPTKSTPRPTKHSTERYTRQCAGSNRCHLRSDEPKADQHQHAGQGGEQEAIGNAGRQVATD